MVDYAKLRADIRETLLQRDHPALEALLLAAAFDGECGYALIHATVAELEGLREAHPDVYAWWNEDCPCGCADG